MKWAIYRIHYGIDYIDESINSIVDQVDKVFIFYSLKPWIQQKTFQYKGKKIQFPENPETFDPVQLDFGIKGAKCPDYICKHFKNSINSYIDINEIPPNGEVNDDNTLFITEAPAGAQQGWVKFLIVNCPLPIQIDFETVMDDNQISDTDMFFL